MNIPRASVSINTSAIIIFHLFFPIWTYDRCARISLQDSPRYKLSQRGRRSNGAIISRREVSSPKACEEFAIAKKALAFNYRRTRKRRGSPQRRRGNDPNCHALECPVINDFSTFVNDTRFDYYSSYRQKIQSENGSLHCLPRVGMFYISDEWFNFTEARNSCRKLEGTLAHVASEERTLGMGKMIEKVSAFVGLTNRDEDRQWKNEFDEPLACFDYRGWGEGEPTHSRGCVLLSVKNNHSASWSVSPCSKKFPYICEITPRDRKRKKYPF